MPHLPRLAIIGGTGFEEPEVLGLALRHETVSTRFGPVPVAVGTVGGEEVVFLSRHRPGHALPPHAIPYLAHTAALVELGVERIAATAAVGALRPDIPTGSLVVLDQFIDWTRRRPLTWFQEGPVVHTDFSEPYCPELRAALVATAAHMGVAVRPQGCYVGVEGPRFETPAEVRALAVLGGDVVGMTGVPEAVLAREAGMCYAAVAVVTNPGAGLSAAPIAHEEVTAVMQGLRPTVVRLLLQALAGLPRRRERCPCGRARL